LGSIVVTVVPRPTPSARSAAASRAVDHRGKITEHLGAAFDEAHRRKSYEIRRIPIQVLVVDGAHVSLLTVATN
jgi:hypothetical protein